MPALYRSKSFRRFEETNNRLTDFLEKDNIKVLATAAAQLFISTPHLDKWFKSSTGTICFLKDFTRKCSYYFRLYSLMQGQLWEQEMESPFSYQKASYLFHYLTVNRFNYGFKFICEDEAERFYSCITKFSSVSPIIEVKSNIVKDKEEPELSLTSSGIKRDSRRNLSATVCGSYLTPKTPTPDINQDTNAKKHKSRRLAYSIDRKRKIEKSDISCPFRCSCVDLNFNDSSSLGKTDTDSSSNIDTIRVQNQVGQASIESNTLNTVPKYSQVVQRALSSASSQTTASTSTKIVNLASNKGTLRLNRLMSGSSSSLNSSSFAGSNTCLNRSVNIANMTPILSKKNESSLMAKSRQNLINELKNHSSFKEDLSDEELELTKKILIQNNVPINKKLVNELKEYIQQYGSTDKFKKAIELQDEKNKLNAFVAASSAAVIGSKTNIPIESPLKQQNRFQTVFPSHVLNTPPSPMVSKLRHPSSTSYTTMSQANMHTTTPTTPSVNQGSITSNRNQYSSSYQPITPMSIMSRTNHSILPASQSERTPVRTNPMIANCIAVSNLSRTQTPSPLRHSQFMRQNLMNTPSSISTIDSNAPPKPPRRSSLKVVN